ncbi:MAG TPA: ABC transporter ATP-binding protein [Vicinamibacterales bacterium]|nr:ABC transporter ATP-binding protein [Vicinamibacterales bacterium]
MAKLEARSVSVEYVMTRTQSPVQALRGVSLAVEPGEFVAVVGPSGCGKTTLLNVIAGLVRPQAGSIHLDGVAVTGPGRERAMVFQSAALMPWQTVLGNVSYGLELQGASRVAARSQARRFIELVGLSGFEESYPRELSGGMQQRANLARALAVEPELLLLDEPLAAVDAQTREYMQNEIQRIWMQTRHSAILVTHQIREAIYLADRVAVMSARPGHVKAVLSIDLPRPRSVASMQDPRFHALEVEIWTLLQPESPYVDAARCAVVN